MRNVKVENHWNGDEYWTKVGHVTVTGDQAAAVIQQGASQQEAEKVIQDWQKVAVLKASPSDGVMVGFITPGHTHVSFLNEPIEPDGEGRFGMHLGDSDVTFFLLSKDPKTNTKLELVEVTTKDDPKYESLPLY
jgi:hypothetical protein